MLECLVLVKMSYFMIKKNNFFYKTKKFRLEPNRKNEIYTDNGLLKIFFVSFFTKIAFFIC